MVVLADAIELLALSEEDFAQVPDYVELPEGQIYFYRLTNLVNGKTYIGQTNNLQMRYYQYRYVAKYPDANVISKALHKYGFRNFAIEHIASARTMEDANEMEIALE